MDTNMAAMTSRENQELVLFNTTEKCKVLHAFSESSYY
jgi:hypothetical protein